ncbi:MAG: GH1 family beta-glucosidase [Pseudomonadota bacterium]
MTTPNFKRADFPNDFIFGTATSAYQIEGHSFGGAGTTHWDSFAATPGNVVRGENGTVACDHFHRWEADLDLVAAAGIDAYRFSTSWARIMPDGRGTPNSDGLDFYDRLVDGMLARGLKPCATLYHWELPQPLADLGGWRNRDIAGWFSDFAAIVHDRLGDRLFSIAPINEPWCVAWLSHFMGHHAPGMRDIRAAARAMHHVLLAQGAALQTMRAAGGKNLGAVMNFEYAEPADASEESHRLAHLYDGIYNQWFVSALRRGEYPAHVVDGLAPHLPDGWQDDFATIQAEVDWLGINYYTRKLIGPSGGLWPGLEEREGPLPKTAMEWEIYPDGLYHFMTWVNREFGDGLPIYVTENGMAAYDSVVDGKVDDQIRIDYLNAHVKKVQQALSDGVPLKGYFIWSLMDNYEWALGYDKRFGLVHVDFDSLERTPKASYHALAAALRSGGMA